MRPTDYEQIFRHRGGSYHAAMELFPTARSQEFRMLFKNHPLKDGEFLIDCPALGGYLESNVPEGIRVKSLDFCPQSDTVEHFGSIEKLEERADRAICLAASHHIEDLETFLVTLTGKVRPGGFLHLADVTSDNAIRSFLDDFVGKWTSTGHSGIWRDFAAFFSEFDCTQTESRHCPWFFRNSKDLLLFCRLLFGLDKNPEDLQILGALNELVGVETGEGFVKVNWKLTYTDILVR